MSWTQLSLVTDTELGQLEPDATHANAYWGATAWASARAEAKRDLKIWLETDFGVVPGVADRVRDRWNPEYAFQYTGSAFTDVTDAVSDDSEEDLNLATAFTTFGTDKLYVGAIWEFDGLFVHLLDSVNATASVLTVKYWGYDQWTSLTVTNGTASAGKTFVKSGRITWTLPSDWERRTLNGTGEEYYWVELSISAALTAGTAASQVLPIRAPDGLKRVAQYLALYHVLNGISTGATAPQEWKDKALRYWDKATALYSTLKQQGGIPLDINLTGAIDRQEAQIAQPVRLGRG